MRLRLPFIILTISFFGMNGCSEPVPTTAAPNREPELAFKPKYTVEWPGKPYESSFVIPNEKGEQKNYNAMFTRKAAGVVMIFSVNVMEFSKAHIDEVGRDQMLKVFTAGHQKFDVSRKEFEFGPKKSPGLEIVQRLDFGNSPATYHRDKFVLADLRIYSVGVTSTREEDITSADADAFLRSFAIDQ